MFVVSLAISRVSIKNYLILFLIFKIYIYFNMNMSFNINLNTVRYFNHEKI